MADRKKVVRVDNTQPALKVEGGAVVEVPRPVLEEFEMEAQETEAGGVPRHVIHTPNGDAVYEYVGDCWDCALQKIDMPLFKCVTDPLRADAEMGNQLASFWNDGVALPLCMNHYHMRQGQLPKQSVTYEIIEKRW